MKLSARYIDMIRKHKTALGTLALALLIVGGSAASLASYQVAADEAEVASLSDPTTFQRQQYAALSDPEVIHNFFGGDLYGAEPADNSAIADPDATLAAASQLVEPNKEVPISLQRYFYQPISSIWSKWWGDSQDTSQTSRYQYADSNDTATPSSQNTGGLPSTSTNVAGTTGKVRVMKTAWHWDYERSSSGSPVLVPLYDLRFLDPVQYGSVNATDAQYASTLSVTKNLPGVSDVQLAAQCGGSALSPNKMTSRNGFADFTPSEAEQAGCQSLSSIEVGLVNYGQPTKVDGSYNYYFAEKSKAIIPAPANQDYAGTVFIGYRPTIAGLITDESGTPASGITTCLFYRQPTADEPCNKDGLSISGKTDGAGRYVIYGSWGDYAQKGAGASATLTVERGGQRQICAKDFTIKGDEATLVNCKLAVQAIVASTSGSSTVSKPSYSQYHAGPSSYSSTKCPTKANDDDGDSNSTKTTTQTKSTTTNQTTAAKPQAAQPTAQPQPNFFQRAGNAVGSIFGFTGGAPRTGPSMICAAPPAPVPTYVPKAQTAVASPPKAPKVVLPSCVSLNRQIQQYRALIAEQVRLANASTDPRFNKAYYAKIISGLNQQIGYRTSMIKQKLCT